MPVSKDDFSAFDEAVKAAKATTSRTEDDFSAFDEAVKKKRKPSDISTTEQPTTSKEPQDGVLESTTSTTEPQAAPAQAAPTQAPKTQVIVGELQQGTSPEEQYGAEQQKVLPPRGLLSIKDGYIIDKSITEEFEDFPEVAEKLEIKSHKEIY